MVYYCFDNICNMTDPRPARISHFRKQPAARFILLIPNKR